jgi:hypothetical protein
MNITKESILELRVERDRQIELLLMLNQTYALMDISHALHDVAYALENIRHEMDSNFEG